MPESMKHEQFPQRWVVRAMKKIPNLTLADLGGMSYETLSNLPGFGTKTVNAVWNHFHPDTESKILPTGETAFNIPLSSIDRVRYLRTTWPNFGVHTKEDFDALDISDDDIARLILNIEKEGTSHIQPLKSKN